MGLCRESVGFMFSVGYAIAGKKTRRKKSFVRHWGSVGPARRTSRGKSAGWPVGTG